MTSSYSGQPGPPGDSGSGKKPRLSRAERRRERIRQQIHEARHGRHIVPTWVMALILGLLLAGWLYLIITSR
ncbi:hypothetical protein [Actinoplanes regularis]|uniref:Uncharacterized protein n=1 Tax=Actinoplanes regularis TaxID=52697 RepID=A0A238XWC2_9ACTN|nr:hypothetical protein [Actinoplanes regularis]GIE86379.1 hypothetical protein Are01nite_28590 [Actinoplanes regularis]GLW28066.1 hypothetical protein Areg01_10060 [Actinoplanes regularis]SNR63366.1 hypothetical protein SAMN06264365_10475 [Actinoplanes regularis]